MRTHDRLMPFDYRGEGRRREGRERREEEKRREKRQGGRKGEREEERTVNNENLGYIIIVMIHIP